MIAASSSKGHGGVRTIAVVGAGVMGRGIAYAGVVTGHEVHLVDTSADSLASARDWIDREISNSAEVGRLTVDQAQEARRLLSIGQDLESACSVSEAVIEAVVESIDAKHAVLRRAEAAASDGVLIATNTSALSITEVISCLSDPQIGIGMHFFNPVHKMKLIEVVSGLQTASSTATAAEQLGHALGKRTVRVQDSPGFVTSRINALIGNEALRMLESGVGTAQDIDDAIRMGLNHPMGPLEMGDLVGWDTRLKILQYLEENLGSRFRPTGIHRRLVAAGHYGRKTGRGIYHYDDE